MSGLRFVLTSPCYHIISSQTLTLILDSRATGEDAPSSQSIDRIASHRNCAITYWQESTPNAPEFSGQVTMTPRLGTIPAKNASEVDLIRSSHMEFQASYIFSRLCMWFGFNGGGSLRNFGSPGSWTVFSLVHNFGAKGPWSGHEDFACHVSWLVMWNLEEIIHILSGHVEFSERHVSHFERLEI